MKENPLVSVLVFAYNHEDYIEEAINSVVSQKCSFDFEVIVSDDCSTDSTLRIINQLQLKYPNLIRIISNGRNLGLNRTFVNAVRSAKGVYLAPLGGDDYWIVENKLEMQVQKLLSDKEIAYVHTEYKSLNVSDNVISNHINRNWNSVLMRKKGKESLLAMLSHNWTGYPCGTTSCYRKAPLLTGINNHPEIMDYDLSGEGTITHASMSYYGGVYAFIPIQTAMYRVHAKSLSHRESRAEQFEFQKRYYLLRLFTAESFGLTQDEVEVIRRRGLLSLLKYSVSIEATNEFQIFARTQYQGFNKEFYYWFLLYWSRFSLFRLLYRMSVKYKNLIQDRYRQVSDSCKCHFT